MYELWRHIILDICIFFNIWKFNLYNIYRHNFYSRKRVQHEAKIYTTTYTDTGHSYACLQTKSQNSGTNTSIQTKRSQRNAWINWFYEHFPSTNCARAYRIIMEMDGIQIHYTLLHVAVEDLGNRPLLYRIQFDCGINDILPMSWSLHFRVIFKFLPLSGFR